MACLAADCRAAALVVVGGEATPAVASSQARPSAPTSATPGPRNSDRRGYFRPAFCPIDLPIVELGARKRRSPGQRSIRGLRWDVSAAPRLHLEDARQPMRASAAHPSWVAAHFFASRQRCTSSTTGSGTCGAKLRSVGGVWKQVHADGLPRPSATNGGRPARSSKQHTAQRIHIGLGIDAACALAHCSGTCSSAFPSPPASPF